MAAQGGVPSARGSESARPEARRSQTHESAPVFAVSHGCACERLSILPGKLRRLHARPL